MPEASQRLAPSATSVSSTVSQRHFTANFNSGTYSRVSHTSTRRSPGWARGLLMSRTWLGRMNNASSQENSSSVTTTTGIENTNLPMMPSMNISGRKATMVVSTVAVTGPASSHAPRMAARSGRAPCSMCQVMFSPMMMASSTIRPSTMMKPNMVSRFSVAPPSQSANRPEKKMTGSPQAVVMATAGRRNNSSVASTRMSPRPPLLVSTPSRRRVMVEKSW